MQTRRQVIGQAGALGGLAAAGVGAAHAQSDPLAVSPPITNRQAVRACVWLKQNFLPQMTAATTDTEFSPDLLCAMACQETAYRWLKWMDQGVETVLRSCVLDGSGDVPDTTRNAFPKNTAAFREKYGDEFTELLVAEGNFMRSLLGWSPVTWLYKGYGIFQYDLQFVTDDEAYFRNKLWHSFEECLARVMAELKASGQGSPDLWTTVRKYNGSGPRAVEYANNVIHFFQPIAGATTP
jgi:hypothetical protein